MGCHLAISTENEKTGKGSHIAMLLLLGNCHLVIYLKMEKTGNCYWGMGSIKYH